VAAAAGIALQVQRIPCWRDGCLKAGRQAGLPCQRRSGAQPCGCGCGGQGSGLRPVQLQGIDTLVGEGTRSWP
jgi:hypothetical protein